MGYTTEFSGSFTLDKPLEAHQIEFLKMFAETRRVHRNPKKVKSLIGDQRNERCFELLKLCKLPLDFYCGVGYCGQDSDDSVVDNNRSGIFPGLWNHWVPSEDGTKIEWDGGEKFYDYVKWIVFIIDNFLKPWSYTLNGEVEWQGEERDDIGLIIIKDNVVKTKRGHIVYR